MSIAELKGREITDYERRVVQATSVVLGQALEEIVARRDFPMFEAAEKIVKEMLSDARKVLEESKQLTQ